MRKSVLIHSLCVLVLAQLEQAFNLFDTPWRYITSDSQQLCRLDLVPEQPICPCQLENDIRFIRREVSQELQVVDSELGSGERLNALGTKSNLPCIVSFQ